MSNGIGRREFLSRAWKWGAALIGVAGGWTTWDILQPRITGGFGGVIKTKAAESVPDADVEAIRAARTYLTKIDGEVVAISEKCPHLGCRVPWCESSGQFECPCHGSIFNRAGEYRDGPTPRGMDRYEIEIIDGIVHVDTGAVIAGPALGAETLNEPARGPSCEESSHG
jgi:cytochrome b6-f complex iron-sulfur subunit